MTNIQHPKQTAPKIPTNEDIVIWQRQMRCKHAMVKGLSDTETRCVHCGMAQSGVMFPGFVP